MLNQFRAAAIAHLSKRHALVGAPWGRVHGPRSGDGSRGWRGSCRRGWRPRIREIAGAGAGSADEALASR
jgi:hypothetical protein